MGIFIRYRSNCEVTEKHRLWNNNFCRSSLLSRSLIILVYLFLSAVLSRIPIVGRVISFLYLSLISSYYCFEYRFLSQSLSTLRSRVSFLETRWVYFLGFGIPPTLLSSSLFKSATLNLAIWSLLFPLFLLMAASSDPLPYDPIKPAKSHDLPGQELSKGTTPFASLNLNPEARLPDAWPTRVPVLYLAVLLDDLVSGFLATFLRSSSSGPKKSAEGYGGGTGGGTYGSSSSSGYDSTNIGPSTAYAQRRDAYNLYRPSGGNQPVPPPPSSLQAGFGNVTSAPPLSSYTKPGGGGVGASGFARQADSYFASTPSSPSKRQDAYGVGKAGGVAVRRENLYGDAGGVQSRRRQGGSS